MNVCKIALALLLSPVATAFAGELVTNGGFEANTGNGQLGFNTSATAWTTSGYTFLFAPGTADTTGAVGQYGGLFLWGLGNGSANGLSPSSPNGGYYVAADGDFQTAPITQQISGLIPGASYNLSFSWAGAQQLGFDGPTTDQWIVSLGGQTQSTPVINVDNHGFSGWIPQTFTFTASSAMELLSFLANSSPAVPPFALLDGVSLQEVPEPASLGLLAVGLTAVGLRRRNHR